MVFSKIDLAQKHKQPHKNPREILNELKETDKKINELNEQGDIAKQIGGRPSTQARNDNCLRTHSKSSRFSCFT
ncbi:surfeit locus protein 6 homolog [Glossina fuscipes]|uniref:Surfeit locus protein 6 homolog n=1 Tax=Glossina fuscipes TaxID=7396 RepID=A0A9C6E0W6_9MUSC|nr:surfeit locus protein 6 homolog [Glossina fuscipes]